MSGVSVPKKSYILLELCEMINVSQFQSKRFWFSLLVAIFSYMQILLLSL